MKMKKVTTNGRKLGIVEVSKEGKGFRIEGGGLRFEVNQGTNTILLSKVDSIIGTITDGKLDFDAESYVEKLRTGSRWNLFKITEYRDYIELHKRMYNAIDSFLSLLVTHKIEYDGKKLVILQITPNP